MNDSGRAVQEAANFFKLGAGEITVFQDELELPPAKVRVKVGGGIAGHNGLRSITSHIGNDYRRVRLGIGHPGVKEFVHHHVLSDFSRDDGAWVTALCEAVADVCRSARRGPGRLVPEQGASGAAGQGVFREGRRRRGLAPKSRRDFGTHHGIQMRYRRIAQCRQVDAVQCADRNRGGAGGQLSVLHHRAECRRGRRARSAARRALRNREIGADHSDPADLRRHRRSGARRLEGRGPRQPVPRQYPRGRCDRPCRALLRG